MEEFGLIINAHSQLEFYWKQQGIYLLLGFINELIGWENFSIHILLILKLDFRTLPCKEFEINHS